MDINTLKQQEYDEFYKYIPTSFTDNISSRFGTFVYSLACDQAQFIDELNKFKENINVLTANTEGVTAWEAFLQLPSRPDLTLQARRGRLFSHMVTQATIESIKKIVNSYVNSNDFEIYEYWTTSNPASAFVYEIQLNIPFVTGQIRQDLIDDLTRVQPAHCTLFAIIDGFQYLSDSLIISDTISTESLTVFQSDVSQSDDTSIVVS